MTKFLVKIWAYNHFGECEVESEDNPTSLENAIVDKLGENVIKWELTGMYGPTNRITYEEVINDANTTAGPIQTKEGSGPRMGAGAS
jgi:hypothetical protein|tara:strand:+ start:153 stop:413 length:261 start_codon:yes stop_codon:yes gene_type:complete